MEAEHNLQVSTVKLEYKLQCNPNKNTS